MLLLGTHLAVTIAVIQPSFICARIGSLPARPSGGSGGVVASGMFPLALEPGAAAIGQ